MFAFVFYNKIVNASQNKTPLKFPPQKTHCTLYLIINKIVSGMGLSVNLLPDTVGPLECCAQGMNTVKCE